MSTFELKIAGDDATVVRTEQVRLKSWDDHNVSFTVGSDGLFAISSEDGILISREEIIRYLGWDGSKWIAKLWPPASFYLSRDGTSTGFVDNKLQFVDWDGKQVTATPWIPNVNVNLSSFSNLHANMGMMPPTSTTPSTGTTTVVTADPVLVTPATPMDVISESPFDEIQPAATNPPPTTNTTTPTTAAPIVTAQPIVTPVVTKAAQTPKLEGWLHKRGDVGIVLDWTWKQRYFRENEDGKLYYYDDRNSTNPSDSKGKIDLSIVTKIEVNPSMNLGFNIVTPGRNYVLRATSKADLHYWTTNLPLKCPKITPSPSASPVTVTRAASQPGLVVNSMNGPTGANGTTSSSSANGSSSTADVKISISPSQIASAGQSSSNNGDISALRSNIRNASFSRDKIAIIQTSANSRTFTCSQVFELLKELPFSEDKHEACLALYPKISDAANFAVVLEAFDFSSDKDRVKKALGLM
eukprot:TRINITY_DN4102_c0_g1_i1.p1 TRINITY_DN4102_c0_g1~~TRINITY_DN4102_c0_g1_i1.p1  ORF type:complete len:469 (-),score=85.93 TRINITY_DN4102_c0_g1_i1:32-1438(-)